MDLRNTAGSAGSACSRPNPRCHQVDSLKVTFSITRMEDVQLSLTIWSWTEIQPDYPYQAICESLQLLDLRNYFVLESVMFICPSFLPELSDQLHFYLCDPGHANLPPTYPVLCSPLLHSSSPSLRSAESQHTELGRHFAPQPQS